MCRVKGLKPYIKHRTKLHTFVGCLWMLRQSMPAQQQRQYKDHCMKRRDIKQAAGKDDVVVEVRLITPNKKIK